MAEPYAGYNGYTMQQGGWAGYPAAYPGYQPTAAYPAGYDYSSYHQQQPYYAYSSYYPQQHATTEPATGATGTTVAPPHPPSDAPPPLPMEAPPPLPSADAPPPPADTDANVKVETASASAPEVNAATAGTADARSPQAAAAPESVSVDNAYAHYQQGQHPYQFGYYGQAAYAQGYGHSSYDYRSGQYLSSSTNPYASQVPTPTPPSLNASVATGAAPQAPATVQDYSRHLPSAVPTQGSAMPAAATGSNSTPIGVHSVSSTGQGSSLEAMKAAAEAVAKRLSATCSQGQPQYLSVNVTSTAPNAGAAAADHSKDLPPSLQQYVARALAVLGRSNETRLELRTVLRDAIAKHKKEGTLWSTDWDREPLPALSKQARLSEAIEVSGKQQQQRGGAVWDRLGSSAAQRQRPESTSPKSSRKRIRDRGYSDSDSSSSEDEGDGYGSWSRKQKVELSGKKGKGRQVFVQQPKKGKKNKNKHWAANASDEWTAEEHAKHAARTLRFAGDGYSARSSTLAAYGWDEDSAALDDGEFIVGTCQKLEKRYLRLTRAPLPEEVRPQPVLAAALQRLLGMIESKADKYLYYNDQLKAMRQDLTVQGIKNEFTVQVYEAHARAALEYGDGAEYNQCQTQLVILYAAGLPGSHAEFAAYRLLYQSVHAAAGEGRKLLGTMRQLVGNKVGQVADSAEVHHAMQVRKALASSSVSRFFRLYLSAPRLGRCLMDVAVKQLRWKALNTLVRAHKPGALSLVFLARTLGFILPEDDEPSAAGSVDFVSAASPASTPEAANGSGAGVQCLRMQFAALTVDDEGKLLPGCSERSCCGENGPAKELEQGLLACLEWCQKHGAVFDDHSETGLPSCSLLTKECWNKLFIPQDTTKVAHGDVNLDIRDFLAL